MTQLVLLTGATGFVGKQVYKSLIDQKVKVRAVVRETKIALVQESEYLESIISTKDLFSESDIWWQNACNEVDIVIHVAWYAEPGKYLDSPKNINCLMGSLALAKGAVLAKVKRFIGVGSCLEYDLDYGERLSIDTPIKPLTQYAGAKAATYFALTHFFSDHKVAFAWCRLFYLYGEGEDSRRLAAYITAMLKSGQTAELTSGNQIRDFLDVREAGQMISKVALSQNQGALNICSGIPLTVRELAEKIADKYGRRDLLRFGARVESFSDPACVVGVKT